MTAEIDIYHAAQAIIDQYGDGALLEAMSRIESYRASKNPTSMSAWARIADAVEWMQTSENLIANMRH